MEDLTNSAFEAFILSGNTCADSTVRLVQRSSILKPISIGIVIRYIGDNTLIEEHILVRTKAAREQGSHLTEEITFCDT